MIGYPRGLAEKFSLDRKVSNNTDPSYFSADLDCFHGNSGSPVFIQRPWRSKVSSCAARGIFRVRVPTHA